MLIEKEKLKVIFQRVCLSNIIEAFTTYFVSLLPHTYKIIRNSRQNCFHIFFLVLTNNQIAILQHQ